jgi:hypothetical protein
MRVRVAGTSGGHRLPGRAAPPPRKRRRVVRICDAIRLDDLGPTSSKGGQAASRRLSRAFEITAPRLLPGIRRRNVGEAKNASRPKSPERQGGAGRGPIAGDRGTHAALAGRRRCGSKILGHVRRPGSAPGLSGTWPPRSPLAPQVRTGLARAAAADRACRSCPPSFDLWMRSGLGGPRPAAEPPTHSINGAKSDANRHAGSSRSCSCARSARELTPARGGRRPRPAPPVDVPT